MNLLYLDNFAHIFFDPFPDQTDSTYYHWYCCGPHAPLSRHQVLDLLLLLLNIPFQVDTITESNNRVRYLGLGLVPGRIL